MMSLAYRYNGIACIYTSGAVLAQAIFKEFAKRDPQSKTPMIQIFNGQKKWQKLRFYSNICIITILLVLLLYKASLENAHEAT